MQPGSCHRVPLGQAAQTNLDFEPREPKPQSQAVL